MLNFIVIYKKNTHAFIPTTAEQLRELSLVSSLWELRKTHGWLLILKTIQQKLFPRRYEKFLLFFSLDTAAQISHTFEALANSLPVILALA